MDRDKRMSTMNDKKIYKLGIIGYGGMGSWHAENITKRIEHLEIGGTYDVREERQRQAEKDGYKAFNTAEELLASDVDIILVATPNDFHKDYSIRAMEAGKAVVCEKPVCMNSQELEEILAASKRTGKFFTVHQNRRWDIDYLIVKNVIDNKIIGNPYYINSRLYGSKGLPGDWRSDKTSGGGMLYDWGIHLIDQMLCLIDSEVESVYCQSKNVNFKDVDDVNRIMINFKNGIQTQIVVDSWCYIGENRWHISGDDGTMVMHDWLSASGKIIKANIKEIDWEEGVIVTSTGRTRTMAPRPKESLQEMELPITEGIKSKRWEEFYENVIDVLEGRAEQLITHDEVRKSMKVLEACFKSAEENKTIIF